MKLVKQLREQSGAPITECKDAINASTTTENSTDEASILRAASEWLRKRGVATATKKSGRAATEGLIGIALNNTYKSASIIEINSETDFAAKNERFQSAVQQLAALKLSENSSNNNSAESQNIVTDTVTALRENIQNRRSDLLTVNNGVIGIYMHNSIPTNTNTMKLGKTGAMVAIETSSNIENSAHKQSLIELANKLAMQIVAAQPKYVDKSSIPADVIAKEREILLTAATSPEAAAAAAAQAKRDGQSSKANKTVSDPKILERMIDGRMNKYYEENVLNEQKFVISADNTAAAQPMKVSAMLGAEGKRMNSELKITGFIKYSVGEGLAPKETLSFAEEVASKLK